MTTYGDMQSRIADELIDEAITTTHITRAIQTAIKHYQREPFWFNNRIATFATVADQEYYSSTDPADFENIVRIDAMSVANSTGSLAKMYGLENSLIEDVQDGTVTGIPKQYSRYANRIRLYPIPDDAYTITMRYIYKLDALSADTDTNAWVDECEELIRQAAKRVLCIDVLMADDMAARFATIEKIAYDRIRKEDKDRRPQQFLRTDLGAARAYNINLG
jgi:hypothetical protein